jgi:hypothetical protein
MVKPKATTPVTGQPIFQSPGAMSGQADVRKLKKFMEVVSYFQNSVRTRGFVNHSVKEQEKLKENKKYQMQERQRHL